MVIDNKDPFRTQSGIIRDPTGTVNRVNLCDAPQAPGYSSLHINGTFTDYLMFKPDGENSIFVTLGRSVWTILGTAVYPSLAITPAIVNFPSELDGSDEFPMWTTVFINP